MRILKTLVVVALLALSAQAKTVTVTLLATTDMHGNMYPYDYLTGKPAVRGLVKIASLIKDARADNPNSILIDCGDTIQGATIEGVYQYYVHFGRLPLGLPVTAPLPADPMMRAMNYLKYDAMVVGNHEFNFSIKNLNKARSEAEFPWISANTKTIPGGDDKPFAPYIVKTVAGVKVGIIGITTPGVPAWDEPSNYKGYTFQQGKPAVEAALAEMKAKEHPDVVIVAAHAGLGKDLKTGKSELGELHGENMVYDIAAGIPGIDAVVFGHTHNQLPEYRLGDVLMMQPKNWAISMGRMDFTLDDSSGHWKVTAKSSRLIPVTDATPIDETVASMAKPYHDAAERYLNSPVAESKSELNAQLARVEDNAMIDAVQQVEMHYAKADVSFASSFNPRAHVRKGPVTVREVAALYLYDNTLIAIEGTGKMVREALENAARYYKTCEGDCSNAELINSKVIGYNYDMAQGVEYEIDLTKPEGQRISKLMWKGKPLADDQKLRIAVNNYRYGGSGGYTMFKQAPIVWHSTDEMRDMIIEYYTERKVLPSEPDHNWKIVPEMAATALARQAKSEGVPTK